MAKRVRIDAQNAKQRTGSEAFTLKRAILTGPRIMPFSNGVVIFENRTRRLGSSTIGARGQQRWINFEQGGTERDDPPMQPLHQCNYCTIITMPTLVRLPSCAITMYAGDHLPPHFHVRTKDGREALIITDTMAILSGAIKPRELADALAWAQNNRAALTQKWQELNP